MLVYRLHLKHKLDMNHPHSLGLGEVTDKLLEPGEIVVGARVVRERLAKLRDDGAVRVQHVDDETEVLTLHLEVGRQLRLHRFTLHIDRNMGLHLLEVNN